MTSLVIQCERLYLLVYPPGRGPGPEPEEMLVLLVELDALNSTSSRCSTEMDEPGLLSIVTSVTKVKVMMKLVRIKAPPKKMIEKNFFIKVR